MANNDDILIDDFINLLIKALKKAGEQVKGSDVILDEFRITASVGLTAEKSSRRRRLLLKKRTESDQMAEIELNGRFGRLNDPVEVAKRILVEAQQDG